MFLFGKHKKALDTTFVGLELKNPAGIRQCAGGPLLRCNRSAGAGFITLCPPKENVLDWIVKLQDYRQKTVLAVNLTQDIQRSFSLVYDFTDLIIIDPAGQGIDSPDISDIKYLLDEIVSLRLCYEHYTPIALRLSPGHSPEESTALLDHCRLSGIDAVVAPGPRKVGFVAAQTLGRLPIVGAADSIDEALACLQKGASLVETPLRPLSFSRLLKLLSQQ